MKKIIICEGKHDGIFFEQLLKNLNFSKDDFKIFDPENQKKKDKKSAETRELNSFIEKYNQNKILIKLEGGKHFAIKIFSTNMRYCVENISPEGLILMIDLDGEEVEKRKNSLIETLNGRMTMPMNLDFSHKMENDHLYHLKTKVSQNNSELGQFHIILFKKSLEHSCGISDGTCMLKEKISKIDEFILRENLINFFSQIIN